MGNSIGGRKKAKVMKIDGETFKLKTPIRAYDVVKDYPGLVLLDSDAVKRLGLRAKPMKPDQELRPKKLYFLVELPKLDPSVPPPARPVRVPRRTRSGGVHMGAKDRLDLLMLSRRSVSDFVLPTPAAEGAVRVKMRLPKAEMEKLVAESKDEAEVAEKIFNIYYGGGRAENVADGSDDGVFPAREEGPWKPGLGSIREQRSKGREVRFR